MIERKFIGLEEGLDSLQKGITKVKNIVDGLPEPQFTSEEWIILYTTIFYMCLQRPPHNYGRQLYAKYKEACEEYIISTVLPSLREKKDDLLLREMLKRWSNHKIMTRRLARFFCYLDRNVNIPRWGLPCLEETSFLSFYYLVFGEMNKQVMDAILTMIDRKRAGGQIDQTLVTNALDLYLEFEENTRKNNAKEEKKPDNPILSSKKIKLISSDGDVFEVDYGVALMSKAFEDSMETISVGDVDSVSVSLVSSKMLTKVIEYCKKHNSARTNDDLKDWDVQFVDVDHKTLFDLERSASYMKINSLKDMAKDKIFNLVEGMTKEEMVQFFALERTLNS